MGSPSQSCTCAQGRCCTVIWRSLATSIAFLANSEVFLVHIPRKLLKCMYPRMGALSVMSMEAEPFQLFRLMHLHLLGILHKVSHGSHA
jgi:hypothetical protein